MVSRIISLLIIIFYIVSAVIAGGGEALMGVVPFTLLPFFMIWYGEHLGQVRGTFGPTGNNPIVNKASPGIFVVFLGWIILLIPIFIAIYSSTITE